MGSRCAITVLTWAFAVMPWGGSAGPDSRIPGSPDVRTELRPQHPGGRRPARPPPTCTDRSATGRTGRDGFVRTTRQRTPGEGGAAADAASTESVAGDRGPAGPERAVTTRLLVAMSTLGRLRDGLPRPPPRRRSDPVRSGGGRSRRCVRGAGDRAPSPGVDRWTRYGWHSSPGSDRPRRAAKEEPLLAPAGAGHGRRGRTRPGALSGSVRGPPRPAARPAASPVPGAWTGAARYPRPPRSRRPRPRPRAPATPRAARTG